MIANANITDPRITLGYGVGGNRDATAMPQALCPDLLRHEQIGEADNLRGRVVRAFFWLMRAWPT